MRRRMVLAAAAALMVAVPSAPAMASGGLGDRGAVEHCVVRVTGTKPTGELVTTSPVCSTDRGRALRAAGVTLADVPIGVHFDGAGLTGSSFTVVGSTCSGGWLNLSALWINRVSSTQNFCPVIRHFDGYNLTSASEDTLSPGGNLSSLNNKANSIQYLP